MEIRLAGTSADPYEQLSQSTCFVTLSTKLTIAFLEAVSLQEGSGSWPRAQTAHVNAARIIAIIRVNLLQTAVMARLTYMSRSAATFHGDFAGRSILAAWVLIPSGWAFLQLCQDLIEREGARPLARRVFNI